MVDWPCTHRPQSTKPPDPLTANRPSIGHKTKRGQEGELAFQGGGRHYQVRPSARIRVQRVLLTALSCTGLGFVSVLRCTCRIQYFMLFFLPCYRRKECPLTLKLHLSSSSMLNEMSNSQRHKKYIEKAKSCVDCRPPQHAMHFAKRMRQKKEAAPDIALPLAFKNGLDALSLWTMNTQVKETPKWYHGPPTVSIASGPRKR